MEEGKGALSETIFARLSRAGMDLHLRGVSIAYRREGSANGVHRRRTCMEFEKRPLPCRLVSDTSRRPTNQPLGHAICYTPINKPLETYTYAWPRSPSVSSPKTQALTIPWRYLSPLPLWVAQHHILQSLPSIAETQNNTLNSFAPPIMSLTNAGEFQAACFFQVKGSNFQGDFFLTFV